MKKTLKLTAAAIALVTITGCSPFLSFDPMTKPNVQPSHDYVHLTNYDRIQPASKNFNLRVVSSKPSALKEDFDLNDLRKKVEARLEYEGYKVSPSGQEIIIDVTRYDYNGTVRKDSGSGVRATGPGLNPLAALAINLVAETTTFVSTLGESARAEAMDFTIKMPAKSYSTEVQVRDKNPAPQSSSAPNGGRGYEKVAQIVFELVSQ